MPTQPKEPNSLDLPLLVQSLFTLIFVLTLCVLWLSGRTPPPELVSFTLLLVGYFFGGRLPTSAVRQQAVAISAFSEALK